MDRERAAERRVVYIANVDLVSDDDGLRKITTTLDAVDCAGRMMIIAATSFPDRVDASLTAQGFFSEQVTMTVRG